MDRNIKTVPQLERGFEPYTIMFKGLMKKNQAGPITVFLQRKDKG